MSEISRAIKAKQTEIAKLQADIGALQRAASIVGGKTKPAAKRKRTRKSRRKMSAAARKAVSKRMKAYWAKKKRAKK